MKKIITWIAAIFLISCCGIEEERFVIEAGTLATHVIQKDTVVVLYGYTSEGRKKYTCRDSSGTVKYYFECELKHNGHNTDYKWYLDKYGDDWEKIDSVTYRLGGQVFKFNIKGDLLWKKHSGY